MWNVTRDTRDDYERRVACPSRTMHPSLKLSLIVGSVLAFYAICTHFFLLNPLPSFEYFDFRPQLTTTMTQAHLKSWHARALAHPYPNPYTFVPRRENIKIALLRNSPLEHEGFSLAIFAEDDTYVVVDAMGRILNLPSTSPDIKGLLDLGHQTLNLPIANRFRNIWMVKRQMTSQPIDRFFYVSETGKRQTSVSGYSPIHTELARPVEQYTHLPQVLQELFGLVLEAREGYQPGRDGGNADREVVSKVMAVLD